MRRAVVPFERHNLGGRLELLGETENIVDFGRTKRVDRLRVIADDGHAGAVGFQRCKNIGLQPVRVLVLVDQYMVEPRTDLQGKLFFCDEMTPVQQQIVIVEYLALLLAHDVMSEQFAQLFLPIEAPGVTILERFAKRAHRVDCPRVNRKTGVFFRKPAGLF